MLWCLRRTRSDIHCVLIQTVPPEIHVLQDADLVLKEAFPEEATPLHWAEEYGSRLQENGWKHHDPDDPAPRSPS